MEQEPGLLSLTTALIERRTWPITDPNSLAVLHYMENIPQWQASSFSGNYLLSYERIIILGRVIAQWQNTWFTCRRFQVQFLTQFLKSSDRNESHTCSLLWKSFPTEKEKSMNATRTPSSWHFRDSRALFFPRYRNAITVAQTNICCKLNTFKALSYFPLMCTVNNTRTAVSFYSCHSAQ